MSSIELTLDQALELVAKDGARADVRVLGALSVAAIITNERLSEFDADMVATIMDVIKYLYRTVSEGLDDPAAT